MKKDYFGKIGRYNKRSESCIIYYEGKRKTSARHDLRNERFVFAPLDNVMRIVKKSAVVREQMSKGMKRKRKLPTAVVAQEGTKCIKNKRT